MPSTPLSYFDRMYAEPDPWGYETSWYERRKYAVTLDALTKPRYHHAFEPGCSIGVLTAKLAARCDRLLAADFHAGALERARQRVAGISNITLEHRQIPRQWPAATFDLIVLSEVAYYLDLDANRQLMERVAGSLAPDGEVVLVHWRGETDYPQTGDQIHESWLADRRFIAAVSYREDAFRLEVLVLSSR